MNVVFYEKEDGTSPVADFLDSLDAKMYAKVSRSIRLLEDRANKFAISKLERTYSWNHGAARDIRRRHLSRSILLRCWEYGSSHERLH